MDRVVSYELALAVVNDPFLSDESWVAVGVVAGYFLLAITGPVSRGSWEGLNMEEEWGLRTYDNVVAVRVEVVANKLGERPLLVAPAVLPLPALWVSLLSRALCPGLQHLKSVRQVL